MGSSTWSVPGLLVVLGFRIAVVGAEPGNDRRGDAVLEAALRGVATQALGEEARTAGAVVCLQVDPGGAPQSVSKEFLRRFRGLPFVRRGAECEARSGGAVERATGAPAVIVTAGPIEWVAADEAHVRVASFRSGRYSSEGTYRVVREPSGWFCLGPILKMSPA